MRRLLALASIIALLMVLASLGVQVEGATSVYRVPMSFKKAVLLYDYTIAGIPENGSELVFVRGSSVVKAIPLIMKQGVVGLFAFPPDSPTTIAVVTDAGDVVIATPRGKLYETIVGFGTLKKACYGYGNIYLLVDTGNGNSVYIYNLYSCTWWVVGTSAPVAKNIVLLSKSEPLDLMCQYNMISVLVDPIAPPSSAGYFRERILIMNSSYYPVDARLIIYYPSIEFTQEVLTHNGYADILIPKDSANLSIYAYYGDKWYLLFSGEMKPRPEGYTFVITNSTMPVPPPTTIPTREVLVLNGTKVSSTFMLSGASRVLAMDKYIVLYGERGLTITTPGGDIKYMARLDSEPVMADTYGDIVAVATKSSTLYIINATSSSLLITYSLPGLSKVFVTRGYVFALAGKMLHAISLRSLKDVFIYKTPGVSVASPYISGLRYSDTVLYSAGDSSIILSGLNATEPFDFRSMMPFTVKIVVKSPWNKPVPGAMVIIDGVNAGRTDKEGVLRTTLLYGNHTIEVVPPKGYYNVTETTVHVLVTRDGQEIDITMKRDVYYLTILLKDPLNGKLVEPVRLTIYDATRHPVAGGVVTGEKASYLLKRGTYTIVVEPVSRVPYYNKAEKSVTVYGDTTTEIELQPKLYPVKVAVVAADTGKTVPAKICFMGNCTTGGTVMLLKGSNRVKVVPLPKIAGKYPMYKTVEATIEAPVEEPVTIKVPRYYVNLTVKLLDSRTHKPVPETLEVRAANFVTEARNGIAKLVVPAGTVSVKVSGGKYYKPFSTIVKIDRDTTITLRLQRRAAIVTFYISTWKGLTPTGRLIVFDRIGGARYVYKVVKEGTVKATLPYGIYDITFEGLGFREARLTNRVITGNTQITIYVQPTLMGFIKANMKLILSLALIVASFIGWALMLRWARKKIAEYRELEELFKAK